MLAANNKRVGLVFRPINSGSEGKFGGQPKVWIFFEPTQEVRGVPLLCLELEGDGRWPPPFWSWKFTARGFNVEFSNHSWGNAGGEEKELGEDSACNGGGIRVARCLDVGLLTE